MISTMIAVRTVSFRVGQTTFDALAADLPDEFAWGGLRHVHCLFEIEKRSADPGGPAELDAT